MELRASFFEGTHPMIRAATVRKRNLAWPANRHPTGAALKRLLTHALIMLFSAVAISGCDKPSISGRKPEVIIGGHGLGPGEFHRPRAIACGPDGCVYVVDMTARIQRFSPDGEFEVSWHTPAKDFGKPTGITVDAKNRVLVADTHYNRVLIYDRDGNELARFGTSGEGEGEFLLTTEAVVDDQGRYYVAEYGGNDRVSIFSPDMKFLGSFGHENMETPLARPQSLLIDRDGTVLVADSVNHRICRFSADGKLLSTFGTAGSEPGQLEYPYDIAQCEDGTLLVCEYGNNRIQRFTRDGQPLETWGSTGRGPGEMIDAWGVAVGKGGRVYVVDSRNHRVQMFRM